MKFYNGTYYNSTCVEGLVQDVTNACEQFVAEIQRQHTDDDLAQKWLTVKRPQEVLLKYGNCHVGPLAYWHRWGEEVQHVNRMIIQMPRREALWDNALERLADSSKVPGHVRELLIERMCMMVHIPRGLWNTLVHGTRGAPNKVSSTSAVEAASQFVMPLVGDGQIIINKAANVAERLKASIYAAELSKERLDMRMTTKKRKIKYAKAAIEFAEKDISTIEQRAAKLSADISRWQEVLHGKKD